MKVKLVRPKILNDVLGIKLKDLETSVRLANSFEYFGVYLQSETVGDILDFPETKMLKARSFGRKSLMEFIRVLAKEGIQLRGKYEQDEEYRKCREHGEEKNSKLREYLPFALASDLYTRDRTSTPRDVSFMRYLKSVELILGAGASINGRYFTVREGGWRDKWK